ncbi:DHA2 family efflux MFS transporter permease subunit [Streptomyces xinghaiensis]|uniref:DHA2 family efflux MFS transporter permease subunit n=1 Tax=Streptomyces xinghaiensis TaxID=1038928 RepID=UPI000D1C315B|nr:DHA2 family efflux MFS transporter permease subunit [Streptomyces xinghaiensis]
MQPETQPQRRPEPEPETRPGPAAGHPAPEAGPDHPDHPDHPGHPARWLILAVVCLVELVVVLDNTVLNVAIPSLTAELGASTADIQWVINAYALVQAGLLLTAGSTADRYGRKRMLLTGLVLFGIGSLAAGLAGSAGQLIAARAGMGVGAALLLTTTLAVVLQIFGAAERPRAIGIWAAVSALGFAAGPVVGGLVLSHYWWGAIFLVNIPVVLFALAAAAVLVPETRDPAAGRPDLPGAALSVVGMTALVYAVITGPEHGWTSVSVLLPALFGIAGLVLFAAWERRTPHPVLDPRLFRDRRFTGAVTGVVLITFGSGGALYLLTQQLQFIRGGTPLEAGLAIAPFALTVVALNFTGVSARLIRGFGLPTVITCGMAALAAGFAVVALVGDGHYGGLLSGLLLMGVGCAFANPAIAEAVMGSIPKEKAGAGAGVNSTLAELGAGLGVAVLGAVLASRFSGLLPASAAGADSLPEALGRAAGEAERARITSAFAAGLETGQLAGAVAVLAGGCAAGYLLRRAGGDGGRGRDADGAPDAGTAVGAGAAVGTGAAAGPGPGSHTGAGPAAGSGPDPGAPEAVVSGASAAPAAPAASAVPGRPEGGPGRGDRR